MIAPAARDVSTPPGAQYAKTPPPQQPGQAGDGARQQKGTAMTRTATLIKSSLRDFRGDARLYRLSEPHEDYEGAGHEYVIVSASVAYSGPETYIFPADPSGEIVSWLEMPGSFRGSLDHAEALRGAGYEVAA